MTSGVVAKTAYRGVFTKPWPAGAGQDGDITHCLTRYYYYY